MDKSQAVLSDIAAFQKYAKYIPTLKRREVWDELVDRNLNMHLKKYPAIADQIRNQYERYVRPKKVLPSMRSMQFGGRPVEINNSRVFNCAYMPMEHPFAFAELMFLLLGGTGVGYSVQKHHTAKLPPILGPTEKKRRFLVGDSIEGWADAIKVLVKAYTEGKSDPVFDFRDIRPKGARLITSGGKAPGPDPLRICLDQIRGMLNNAVGRKLTSLEVHDINCYIADAVLAGGIRRAAMISLFSKDDYDMLSAKVGKWWKLNPQRGRANNSVVLHRDETTEEEFHALWERIEESGAGEPGIFWTNDYEMGTNPCAEIALEAYQFCNLTEVNVSDLEGQDDFNQRVAAASFIATLQAGYTDFHYLRPQWKEVTERDALIGVGMTGIATGTVLDLNMTEAADYVMKMNEATANLIGINKAARTTTVKPSGTTSLVLGTSSGVHAWHNDYYIRRIRVGKNEALYTYLVENFPELIEDCYFKPHIEAVMSFPQKAPEGAILRNEHVKDILERVKRINQEWVWAGHREGNNKNNVSCTISIKDNQWNMVGNWMWKNRSYYTGMSVLPHDGGTYIQAPFEDCSEIEFKRLEKYLHAINLKDVFELDDNTNLVDQVACAGGSCEIQM